jgi:hypothetical protein
MAWFGRPEFWPYVDGGSGGRRHDDPRVHSPPGLLATGYQWIEIVGREIFVAGPLGPRLVPAAEKARGAGDD